MDKNEVRELRLRLLANGYTPLRNRDKACYMPGWPTVEVTPELIDEWSRRHSRDMATGVRVENGLAVIDIDIDDQEIVDDLADVFMRIVPELQSESTPWLERSSGKSTVAWFFQTDEVFGRLHSRRWLRPGRTPDDGAEFVEVFGGGHTREFGSFGPHSYGDDGEVARWYAWREQSPADVKLSDLPVVTKAQFAALVDEAERLLERKGWTPVARSSAGENVESRVYDLTDDMVFDCNDGVTRSLDELREAAKTAEGLRCSAGWLEEGASNTSRCLVSLTRAGHVAIWESAATATHLEVSTKPTDYGPEIDRLGEKLRELKERRRLKIKTADDYQTCAAKMLELYAYCPYQQADVVPLWASTPEDGKPVAKLRLEMLPNSMIEEGPRGGQKRLNPADAWLTSERRVTVAGVRMRPDQPRPTFEEDGKLYVNCYDPPLHVAEGGDVGPGLEFFEHLLPDEPEREWFLDWLAFKLRYPHIPGPAVVMVAHGTFGTGRGTLGVLIGKLFGQRYVRSIPFQTFTGRTYQSQYNEWQADALVVMVNESNEDTEGSAYRTKRNAYEHLKELVEPRPTVREIAVKGRSNYRALSSTSFVIATNHADALPIPEHDRRFCVLTNGDTKPVEWWQDVNDWLERPENVAALYDWLSARGWGSYSPFAAPPVFAGKRAMIDESKSDLDTAFEIALASLPGELFTAEQVVTAVRTALQTYNLDAPRGELEPVIKRMVRKEAHRVGERHSYNWFVKFEGARHGVYARTRAKAKQYTGIEAASRDSLVREVRKNGDPSGGGNVLVLPVRK